VDGQVAIGRGIAAAGILLGLIAIWIDFGPNSYWSFDGSLAGLLLILEIAALLALIGALMDGSREYDLAYGMIGGVGFGIYLFYPAVLAFDQWDQLDSGAWLGLCSGLTFVGASIATWGSDRPVSRPSPAGAVVAVVGLGLVVAGLFPDFITGRGSYWNIAGAGHSFGILMLILVVLVGLSIAAAWTQSAGLDSAVLLGGVTLGAGVALPAQSAFNHFGDLATGAWLMGVGCLLVGIGVLVMWALSDEGAPEPEPVSPATV
jgi:hypothetical protein